MLCRWQGWVSHCYKSMNYQERRKKGHWKQSFRQKKTHNAAWSALTGNLDVRFLALLGSGGAPGDALTPVIIQAEDLLHLLSGDFDCHLHDGERCNTNSRERRRRLHGKPSKVHVCLHQLVWWRASNEMNTEYFSLSRPPEKEARQNKWKWILSCILCLEHKPTK